MLSAELTKTHSFRLFFFLNNNTLLNFMFVTFTRFDQRCSSSSECVYTKLFLP